MLQAPNFDNKTANINVKNKVYKNGYKRRIAYLKPQKFTVLSDL